MNSIRIDNTKNPHYESFKELYAKSFPIFEQRTEQQQKYAFTKENYHLMAYFDASLFIGFIAYWDFKTYVYIEHFAVTASIRGKGYGSSILNSFKNYVRKMVLLEIDPIQDEISEARLRFYKRNGFHENIYNHIHPAYRENYKSHQLIVMTTQRPLSVKEYLVFKTDLCDIVMGNRQ